MDLGVGRHLAALSSSNGLGKLRTAGSPERRAGEDDTVALVDSLRVVVREGDTICQKNDVAGALRW